MSDKSDKLKLAQERFGNDVYATKTTGIEIVDVDYDYAKCQMKINSRHCNAMGAVMGGAIYTLADFAFAIAANMHELNTVSLSSNIVFMGQPKGDTLIAEAKPIKVGAKVCHYHVRIADNLDKLVAEVTVSGFKTK